MAPKKRRSCRLKAKIDGKGIEEVVEAEKIEEEGEEEGVELEDEEEMLDLEALVSKTYEFMVSKAQSSARKEITEEKEKSKSVSLDLSDVINLSSSKENPQLSSELQTGLQTTGIYLNLDRPTVKSLHKPACHEAMHCDLDKLMKKSVITPGFEKLHTVPQMNTSLNQRKKLTKLAKGQSAGPKWFNLPATAMTPEIELDLKLLKLRNVLDPKRHYKKNDSKKLPKYFQIGTIVEGAAEFYSSRIPKRERRNNIVNELLADSNFRSYNKRKFQEIQAAKQSGKRGFHKKKMNGRKPHRGRR